MFFRRTKTIENLFVEENDDDLNGDITQKDHISNSAFYVFLAGLFLLPLFFIPLFNLPLELVKTLFWTAIVVISLFLWVVTRLKTGVFEIP